MFSKDFFNFLNLMKRPKSRVYLDHASRTPIDRDVLKILNQAYVDFPGNPGALYKEALESAEQIGKARAKISKVIESRSDEIVFTSGGTESDNLAILGVVEKIKDSGLDYRPHILISSIEHSAVFNFENKKIDVDIEVIPVTSDGILDLEIFSKLLRKETVLVSVMYANNEIGTIQPIKEIAKIIRKFKKDLSRDSESSYPLLHTDAVQALNYCDLNVQKMGVDIMSISGGKIYGPYGIGALYIKSGTPIKNIFEGGSQEFGLRPGTPNTPNIVAFAYAVEKAHIVREKELQRLSVLQKYLIQSINNIWPEVVINGSLEKRLVNNIHFSVSDFSSELLVIELDREGIAVSSKSACKTDEEEVSHVMKALGNRKNKTGDIRVTLGRSTTKRELQKLIKALRKIRIKYKLDKK